MFAFFGPSRALQEAHTNSLPVLHKTLLMIAIWQTTVLSLFRTVDLGEPGFF